MITGVEVLEDVLDARSHRQMWDYLNAPGWRHGAWSDPAPDAPRYSFKHFAGYSASGTETRDPEGIAEELRAASPPLHRMWVGLERALVPGHRLSRCYANAMAPGIGGGIHRDSLAPGHLTMIYYPNLEWSPADGGETAFFDPDETRVIGTVEPRPNRLVVFEGSIPHQARALAAHSPVDRITLMFKTLGPRSSE